MGFITFKFFYLLVNIMIRFMDKVNWKHGLVFYLICLSTHLHLYIYTVHLLYLHSAPCNMNVYILTHQNVLFCNGLGSRRTGFYQIAPRDLCYRIFSWLSNITFPFIKKAHEVGIAFISVDLRQQLGGWSVFTIGLGPQQNERISLFGDQP